jgi:hypothetical protein
MQFFHSGRKSRFPENTFCRNKQPIMTACCGNENKHKNNTPCGVPIALLIDAKAYWFTKGYFLVRQNRTARQFYLFAPIFSFKN